MFLSAESEANGVGNYYSFGDFRGKNELLYRAFFGFTSVYKFWHGMCFSVSAIKNCLLKL